MNLSNNIKQLILLGKNLSEFVVGAEGNISEKINDCFLIKASGASLKNLNEEDFVLCGPEGKQINNFNRKASIETNFHSWIYKNSDYNFIAHTHPENCLKILCSANKHINLFAKKRLFPDHAVYNENKSCIVPYAHPGEDLMEKIKKHVNIFIKKENFFPNVILLKNHGIICCSNSINKALIATEICEKAAKIYLGTSFLEKTNFLSAESIKKISTDQNEIYRKKIN